MPTTTRTDRPYQWRQPVAWRERFCLHGPDLITRLPPGTLWFSMSLTVTEGCSIDDLGQTLCRMSYAWDRFRQRRIFSGAALGWIRATEVVRIEGGSSLPRFKTILIVNPNCSDDADLTDAETWASLWRECADLHDADGAEVSLALTTPETRLAMVPVQTFRDIVDNVVGPSVDPMAVVNDHGWALAFMAQTRHFNFLSAGGALSWIR